MRRSPASCLPASCCNPSESLPPKQHPAHTELYEESGEKIDTRIQKIALGRLGTPEDVANACAFRVSDRSSYISGQIL